MVTRGRAPASRNVAENLYNCNAPGSGDPADNLSGHIKVWGCRVLCFTCRAIWSDRLVQGRCDPRACEMGNTLYYDNLQPGAKATIQNYMRCKFRVTARVRHLRPSGCGCKVGVRYISQARAKRAGG